MKAYKRHLEKLGYKERTVRFYSKSAQRLREYIEYTNQDFNTIGIQELYDFKDHLKELGINQQGAINNTRSLKHYFNFLGWRFNPAVMLDFAKRDETVIGATIDEYDLADIYLSIRAKTPIQKRDQVMLGLVIFQAVRKEELELIELEDIDFKRRTITIPAGRQTNERILKLDQMQYGSLQTYVYEIREELLKTSAKQDSPYLFFSQGKGVNLNNCIQRLLKKLKTQNPSFKSITHIRSSRIAYWIRNYDLPNVQYLSGIKYLSSLERYYDRNTDELKRKLQVFHPLEEN